MHKRLSAELERLSPGHPILNEMYQGGLSVDRVEDAINEVLAARAAAKEPSPELRQAWNALSAMQANYNKMVGELKEAQKKWLWRAKTDWKHKLLRSFRADMDELPLLIDTSKSFYYVPEYWDTAHVRKTTAAVFAQLQRVERLNTLISNAMGFEGLEPGAQAEHLCHALYDDNVNLKSRLAAAEAAIGALQVDISKLKPRKAKAA
jgi:hypothetical protein